MFIGDCSSTFYYRECVMCYVWMREGGSCNIEELKQLSAVGVAALLRCSAAPLLPSAEMFTLQRVECLIFPHHQGRFCHLLRNYQYACVVVILWVVPVFVKIMPTKIAIFPHYNRLFLTIFVAHAQHLEKRPCSPSPSSEYPQREAALISSNPIVSTDQRLREAI